MPQPTSSSVHVDRVLTDISIAYVQSEQNFIGTRVFPIVPVDKQTDKYFTYAKNDWLRDEARFIADGDGPPLSGYTVSSDSYSCDVFGIGKKIGAQAMKNADAPLDLERDAALWSARKLLIKQERKFVTDAFATSVWATDSTPSVTWDDQTSDPINDLETGKQTILASTGFMPNTLVLGYKVFKRLRNHADIVERIKYSGSTASPAVVNTNALAQVFGVERVLVAMANYATNKENETAATDFAATSTAALLCYVSPTPSLMAPSAGYTFAWRGVSGDMGQTIATVNEEIPNTFGSRMIATIGGWDNKIVATDLGYFFSGAVAS